MNQKKTMLDVLRQLEKECGKQAFEIFEWYCVNYGVNVGSDVPSTILYEVFGE